MMRGTLDWAPQIDRKALWSRRDQHAKIETSGEKSKNKGIRNLPKVSNSERLSQRHDQESNETDGAVESDEHSPLSDDVGRVGDLKQTEVEVSQRIASTESSRKRRV